MRKFTVTVEGMAPGLLQNRYDPTAQMVGGSKPTKVNKFSLGDWRNAVYATEGGDVYQPAVHLEQAIGQAAKTERMKGQKTWMDWVRGNLLISPDEIPHGVNVTQFEHAEESPQSSLGNSIVYRDGSVAIHIARAIVGTAAVPRVRALLYPWALTFDLLLRDVPFEMPEEVLRTIIENAGVFPGIGDYRPQTKGKFGTFTLKELKRVK
jgi:hypothetical protein